MYTYKLHIVNKNFQTKDDDDGGDNSGRGDDDDSFMSWKFILH